MKQVIRLLGITVLAVAVAACATQSAGTVVDTAPGFWWGLWNGLTVPFSFIGSLFDSDIAIYQTANNGGWYDFGFVLGIGALGGGASR